MSLNSITLSGYLGVDPDLRFTSNNLAVLNFSLAVNASVPDGKGSYKERTDWIDCVVFGKRAESLSSLLHKGSKVSLIGSLRTSVFENNGSKRKQYRVHIESIELMQKIQDKKEESDLEQDSDYQSRGIYESDLPF